MLDFAGVKTCEGRQPADTGCANPVLAFGAGHGVDGPGRRITKVFG